jgi:hypothetical protein
MKIYYIQAVKNDEIFIFCTEAKTESLAIEKLKKMHKDAYILSIETN